MRAITGSGIPGCGGLFAVLLALAGSYGCKAPPAKRCKLAEPEPINIEQKEGEMLLPKSVDNDPREALVIQITAGSILVKGRAVVGVKDGKVDPESKRDGPDGFFIDPLFKQLKAAVKVLKDNERLGGRPFLGEATLIVHKGAPCRLLAEVLYTANQAELKTYAFTMMNTPQTAAPRTATGLKP